MSKPVKTWREKGLEIAMWDNGKNKSYTWRKTYKNKETGEYVVAKALFKSDLKILADLCDQAYRHAELEEQAFQSIDTKVNEIVDKLIDDLDIPF